MTDNHYTSPVVLAAGGTGGHIFPAEALAETLLARCEHVVLITDKRFANFQSGALSRIDKQTIHAGTVGGSLVNKIRGAVVLCFGVMQAWRILCRLKPKLVVGFGGYPSFPTVFAATFMGIPTVIHEQNSVLGRANRLLVGRVDCIATSFPATQMLGEKDMHKVVMTGNPVRAAVRAIRGVPYSSLSEDGKMRILVTGGSQGAAIFSQVVPAAVAMLPAALRARVRIDQQCRQPEIDAAREAYRDLDVNADLSTFFVDIPARLAATHLVIARSGASTVSELAVSGRPAILVPLPTSMDNHQYYNADSFEQVGGGWIMAQEGFTPASLSARLEAFLTAPDVLQKAAQHALKLGTENAAEKLADVVLHVARTRTLPTESSQGLAA